ECPFEIYFVQIRSRIGKYLVPTSGMAYFDCINQLQIGNICRSLCNLCRTVYAARSEDNAYFILSPVEARDTRTVIISYVVPRPSPRYLVSIVDTIITDHPPCYLCDTCCLNSH